MRWLARRRSPYDQENRADVDLNMRLKEFIRRVGRRPTKLEQREMQRRLRKLYAVIEKYLAKQPHDGPGGEITKKLPSGVAAIVRAHDACDWFAVEEDTASEDGS
jgi:hypothetical protein